MGGAMGGPMGNPMSPVGGMPMGGMPMGRRKRPSGYARQVMDTTAHNLHHCIYILL